MYSLYIITNKVNNKKYIGYTSKSIDERFNTHIKDSKGSDKRLICKALRKYGKDNFTIEMISHAPDLFLAKLFEIRLIKMFDSFGANGYNMTQGGDGSGPHSEEHKKYMSNLLKGRTFSKEWKNKISIKKRGVNPPNKNTSIFTPEILEKLKNRSFFEECIAKELSSKDVSAILGISDESVRRYAKKLGIAFPRNTANTKRKISQGVLTKNNSKLSECVL